jgi:hypothetical protein
LAVLSHHEARRFFPTAGTNSADFTWVPATDPGFERLGWAYQILPYMEQSAIYAGAKGVPPTVPTPSLGYRQLVEVPVSTYNCPSRGHRVTVDVSNGAVYALSDYAGITFSYIGDIQWRNSHNDDGRLGRVYKEFAWRSIIAKGGHNYNGAYHEWPHVTAHDVTDGLSNTLVVMEKAVWSQRYSASTDSSAALCCEVFGWAHNAHQPTMRSIPGDGGRAFGGASGNWAGSPGRGSAPLIRGDDEPRLGERDWDQGFGSAHCGVVMAVFGDGSVRGISNDVDQSMGGVLFHLGCRDDGLTSNLLSYR